MFKAGQKVKIIANTSGHNFPNETILTVKRYHPEGQPPYIIVVENSMIYYLPDIEIFKYSKEYFEKMIVKLEKEKEELLLKREFLDDTNSDEFVYSEYEKYRILKILENRDKSTEDKIENIFSLREKII